MKDTDFLFLTAMLRSREAKMLSQGKIERMLDAPDYNDSAKTLIDCGYPDMSGMNAYQIEDILQRRRSEIFYELSGHKSAVALLDIFRMKYDYHNVKVLVKSMGANEDASYMLSESGRVSSKDITEAFISGDRQALPPRLTAAMSAAVGILSRTSNPQMSDISIDKEYFAELLSLVLGLGDEFIVGYVQTLIDSANLRIAVRAARTGRDSDFLRNALIPGGSAEVEVIAETKCDALGDVFTQSALEEAVRFGAEAAKGGEQMRFELACDNTVMRYISKASLNAFGPAAVVAYLAELEWEITSVRMILTGKLSGIPSEIIRERLRDCHV